MNAANFIQYGYIKEMLLPFMAQMRAAADEMETMVDKKDWPYPAYSDMLFYV